MDVPISISVVDDELIEVAGIKDMSGLAYLVPGMSFRKSLGGPSNISIRGVGNPIGSAALTGTYLDEIPLSLFKTISAGFANN